MKLKNPVSRSCRYCKELFFATDIKSFVCENCLVPITISCSCGCGTSITRSSYQVKLGSVYKQGHATKGKSYLQIHGTTTPRCGFQRGALNVAKRDEVGQKISQTLKSGAHWIFHSPNVSKRRISSLEILVGKYLRGWDHQYMIGKYSVDFALPKKKKVLEVNGCFWHNCKPCGFADKAPQELVALSHKKDEEKIQFLVSQGWEVQVLWEHDIPQWIADKINSSLTTVTRYHDICAGHRVYGHESKCSHAHGHNYRITFTCTASSLDNIGRIIDFSVINKLLCGWLEENWDHRFLLWVEDPWSKMLKKVDPSVVVVPFNPTAENIAKFLLEYVGPRQLKGTGVHLVKCAVEETRKCSAIYEVDPATLLSVVYTSTGLLVVPTL